MTGRNLGRTQGNVKSTDHRLEKLGWGLQSLTRGFFQMHGQFGREQVSAGQASTPHKAMNSSGLT